MNRTEMAEKLATQTGLKKTQATHAVNAAFDIIAQELEQGRSVVLQGFGTFSAKTRAARTAHNPQTGEKIAVAAKTVARFKPGRTLAERLDK